jgi:hypothetical protein
MMKRIIVGIKGHRWATAIFALNVFSLFNSLFFPVFLVFIIPNLIIGIVIVGMLFLPRFHTVRRVSESVGPAVANAGAGGVALVMLAVAAKTMRRLRRSNNENLDFSGFLDPSNLLPFLSAMATIIVVIAVCVFLWHLVGIVRVFASVYLVELSLMSALTFFGIATGMHKSSEDKWADHDRRIAKLTFPQRGMQPNQGMPEMGSTRGRPAGPEYPGIAGPEFGRPEFTRPNIARPEFRQQGSRDPVTGAPAASPSSAGPKTIEGFRSITNEQIRLIFNHSLTTDVKAIRERLVEKLGNPRWRVKRGATQSMFVLDWSNQPEAFRKHIDFGKVTDLDTDARTITIDSEQ